MKNKIFAIIMTAIMLFGMTAYAEDEMIAYFDNEYRFSAELCKDYTVLDMPEFRDIKEPSKELDMLIRLNIISGYEDKELKLDRSINRAEAAKMIFYTIHTSEDAPAIEQAFSKEGMEERKEAYIQNGMEDEFWEIYNGYRTSFSDCSENDWFYPYLCSAKDNGYISGYGDGTFRPDKEVSEIEFLCMVARGLGYNDMIVAEGGYPDGVLTLSSRLGLIDNPKNIPTTRRRAVTILYNALNSKVVALAGYAFNESGEFEKKFVTDFTLLYSKQVYKLHGILKKSTVIPEKTVVFVPDEDFYYSPIGTAFVQKGKEYIFTKQYSDIKPCGACDVYINDANIDFPVIVAVDR